MPITFAELCEALRLCDEVELLELLEITSEDIVAAFTDKIEEHQARLERRITEE